MSDVELEYENDEVDILLFHLKEYLLKDFELTSEQLDRIPEQLSYKMH